MEIKVKSSENITKVELYKMTRDSGILSMKDVEANAECGVKAWVIFDDTNNKGEVSEVLSILTDVGAVWSTTSPTFKESFNEIVNIMDGEPFRIRKLEGTSKAGRKYVNCALV